MNIKGNLTLAVLPVILSAAVSVRAVHAQEDERRPAYLIGKRR